MSVIMSGLGAVGLGFGVRVGWGVSYQPGVYMPLKALFLVKNESFNSCT